MLSQGLAFLTGSLFIKYKLLNELNTQLDVCI
jgi:hypothetical protein